jgi:large subunit ribosomal protein L32
VTVAGDDEGRDGVDDDRTDLVVVVGGSTAAAANGVERVIAAIHDADPDEIDSALRSALLTDLELAAGEPEWRTYPDPLGWWHIDPCETSPLPPNTADTRRTRHDARHPPRSPPLRRQALMAVPKRRTSRSNTRSRRAQWKATPPDLVPIVVGRTHLVPRRLVRAFQRGILTPE